MDNQLTDADVGKHFLDLFHLARDGKIESSDIGKGLERFCETFGVPLEKGNVGVKLTGDEA